MSGKLDALDELLAQIPTLRCPHCESREAFNYVLPQRTVYPVVETAGTSINVSTDQQDCVDLYDDAELFCLSCKKSFPLPNGFVIEWDSRSVDDDEEEA